MKVKVKKVKKEKEFESVKITLIIESKDELLDLYHRFNLCPADMKAAHDARAPYKSMYPFSKEDYCWGAWQSVKGVLDES